MLSRIAESLYWFGRYVERAEDTARILDVYVMHLLEDPSVSEDALCRGLLGIMGVEAPPGILDAARVTDILAYDPSGASSIVSSLRAARQSARGIREVLSSEMWECLNATHNELDARVSQAIGAGPHGFFTFVKDRAAALAGIADSTMSRDDGWRFLVLGRSLERVDMTTRMLLARCGTRSTSAEWVTTLACCSAHQSFLRTYRRGVEPRLVAEFLLHDRLFPRSVCYALALAESCLTELEPDAGRAGFGDETRRLLGRARTDIEFVDIDELMADLPRHLRSLLRACTDASAAIGRRYFRHSTAQEWSVEATAARS